MVKCLVHWFMQYKKKSTGTISKAAVKEGSMNDIKQMHAKERHRCHVSQFLENKMAGSKTKPLKELMVWLNPTEKVS